MTSLLLASSQSNIKEQIQQAIEEKEVIDKKIKLLQSKLNKKVKKESFITHTEFGYINTGGNTNTETFNLDTEVKKRWGKHISRFHIDAQYAEDNDVRTKNKYLLELEYNYDLSSRLAFNYIIGYKDDEFSTYEYQFYTGPGLSYKIIQKDKHNLKFDTNILFALDKIDLTRDYISYRAKGVYSWQIFDSLEFKQALTYRTEIKNNDNYFIYSKTSLNTKLSKLFSAGFSYKYDYINLLSDDTVHKDDTFTINLIVDY